MRVSSRLGPNCGSCSVSRLRLSNNRKLDNKSTPIVNLGVGDCCCIHCRTRLVLSSRSAWSTFQQVWWQQRHVLLLLLPLLRGQLVGSGIKDPRKETSIIKQGHWPVSNHVLTDHAQLCRLRLVTAKLGAHQERPRLWRIRTSTFAVMVAIMLLRVQ
jgi:hypothetical protein